MEIGELKAYRDRWKVVAAIEKGEQRRASLEFRWRQLNTLLAMAAALGLNLSVDQGEVNTVRRRWNLLKDLSQEDFGG